MFQSANTGVAEKTVARETKMKLTIRKQSRLAERLLLKSLALTSVSIFLATTAFAVPQASPPAGVPYTPDKPVITMSRKSPAPTPAPASQPASDWDRFRKSRQREQLLSSTIDNDHEDAGIETKGEKMTSDSSTSQGAFGVTYTGVFAVHAVYSSDDFHLQLPPSATRTQTLFAATTRPPNGSCLEVGTSYTTDLGATTTKAAIYVYDFCKSNHSDWGIAPFPVNGKEPIYVDSNFMKTYAGAKIQSTPAYSLMIFTKDYPLSSDSTWYAQIFNYQTKQWDTLYKSTGLFDLDPRGWSIFETWFQQGQCSESLPFLGAEQLAYYNSSSGKWDPVKPDMVVLKNEVSHGGSQNNNCFTDDHTGPASYQIQAVSPEYASWRVVSR